MRDLLDRLRQPVYETVSGSHVRRLWARHEVDMAEAAEEIEALVAHAERYRAAFKDTKTRLDRVKRLWEECDVKGGTVVTADALHEALYGAVK